MSTHTRSVRLLFAAFGFMLAVWAMPAPVRAQTVTGTVQGTITDQTGAVIPGVTVTLRNADTGQERIVTTNDDGAYSAPFLPLGRYNVTASISNFGRVTRENIEVTAVEKINAARALKADGIILFSYDFTVTPHKTLNPAGDYLERVRQAAFDAPVVAPSP
jgi:hypothetical protein